MTSAPKSNPKAKAGFKRMRAELEVHEGVDMFKEKLNDDDTKYVNGKTLRAKAAPVVSLASEYVRPPQKKKQRGLSAFEGRPRFFFAGAGASLVSDASPVSSCPPNGVGAPFVTIVAASVSMSSRPR